MIRADEPTGEELHKSIAQKCFMFFVSAQPCIQSRTNASQEDVTDRFCSPALHPGAGDVSITSSIISRGRTFLYKLLENRTEEQALDLCRGITGIEPCASQLMAFGRLLLRHLDAVPVALECEREQHAGEGRHGVQHPWVEAAQQQRGDEAEEVGAVVAECDRPSAGAARLRYQAVQLLVELEGSGDVMDANEVVDDL